MDSETSGTDLMVLHVAVEKCYLHGCCNVCSFNDRTEDFTAATVPEYFFFWLLLSVGPLFYVLTILQSCLNSRIPAILVQNII